jgi:hypothetical protein
MMVPFGINSTVFFEAHCLIVFWTYRYRQHKWKTLNNVNKEAETAFPLRVHFMHFLRRRYSDVVVEQAGMHGGRTDFLADIWSTVVLNTCVLHCAVRRVSKHILSDFPFSLLHMFIFCPNILSDNPGKWLVKPLTAGFRFSIEEAFSSSASVTLEPIQLLEIGHWDRLPKERMAG